MKRILLPLSALALVVVATTGFADTTATSASTPSASVHKIKHKKCHKKCKKLMHKAAHKKAHHEAHLSHAWNRYVTVTTTPFTGETPAFSGSDLLFNMSSMNQDMLLLQQKKKVVADLAAQGYAFDRPVLQLSGGVEGTFYSENGFGTGTTDGVNLSTAEIDVNAMASSWANAFMSLAYNGSPISSGNRAPNSQIYMNRGFFTFGNLDKSPFYFSMGKMYVPFGRYENGMVTTPLDVSLAKILSPAALVGFSLNNGVFGSVYTYSGFQNTGGSPIVKQGGANIGVKENFDGTNGNYALGGGWTSNLADSQGQQTTGLSSTGKFGGFAVAPAGNNLAHPVDAYDVNGHVTYGPVTVIGEYIDTIRRYATTDMTFNGAGAAPSVVYAEADYNLPWFDKKYGSMVGVSYGGTTQSLALNLPKDSCAVFASTSLWRETTQSIEYRHDTDYSTRDTASGNSATTNIVGTGKGRNTVTLQMGIYF